MRNMLKSGVFVAAIGLIFAAPASKADPVQNYYCWQEFQACLAWGYDPDMCRDNYFYCRYGYYPAKSAAIPVAMRKD